MRRRALISTLLAALWVAAPGASALPVQYGSVDLLDQAQSRLDGLSGSQAGAAVTVLPGLGTGGRDAIAIGMPGAGPAGRPGAGAVAVIRGSASLPRVLDLSSLDGRNGFALLGAAAGDQAGYALTTVPRAHQPPLLAIGAPYASRSGRTDGGLVYLIDPGRVHGAALDLAHPGRALAGLVVGAAGADTGYALAGGALSARGGDLLIGAPAASGPGGSAAGAAYVLFAAHRPFVVDLAHPGAAAATVLGPAQDAGLGSAVAITPSGFGQPRVWVGAPTASPGGRGLAGSVYGFARLTPGATVALAHGGASALVNGASPGDGLGDALAALAPTRWRRQAMLALGASGASPRRRQAAGEVVLAPLGAMAGTIDLARPAVAVSVLAGAQPFDGAGYALAAIPDPVGGRPALAIGAPFVSRMGGGGDPADEENVGAVYIVGGVPGPFPGDLGRVGSAGVTITGARSHDQAGTALGGGWLSGPRQADLLVGAPFALTASGSVGGAGYLIDGPARRPA